ncbi:MAG: hypothetical protein ACRCVE_12695, partial [Plesiomonas sp.]
VLYATPVGTACQSCWSVSVLHVTPAGHCQYCVSLLLVTVGTACNSCWSLSALRVNPVAIPAVHCR